MASKGGLGMEIDLDLVPAREDGMTAYELMLSESQERMLMVLKPDATDIARAIFDKWDLDFMPIGQVTETGRLVLLKDGGTACDIPLAPLVDDAPEYDRPQNPVPQRPRLASGDIGSDQQVTHVLKSMLGHVDLASRRWVYEQYDSDVMADTIAGPGGDAALVRVHGSQRGLAITTDCTPRYVEADPETGGAQAVAEAYRNICAIGARPLAITNNLNFGNPEKPDIMAQLAQSVVGMGKAAKHLDTPVVSGNVSLYNETDGIAIRPCPVIGMVGVIDDVTMAVGSQFIAADQEIFILGQDDSQN
ncbi:MAG: AIR synthase related protein, partial [Candidatus Puniceispirillaceae bacterium]